MIAEVLLLLSVCRLAIPDWTDFAKKDASRDRPDVLELLQFDGKLRGRSGTREEICDCVVAALQLLTDVEELRRSGEIVPDVSRLIQQGYKFVPTNSENGLGAGQVFGQKPPVGSLCNFGLNRLPKKQTCQEPFEELFFFLRSQVNSQMTGV
jgi:hypothetical protein